MTGFTPLFLQEQLIEEIRKEVKDLRFEDKDGQQVKMHVYAQDLPVKSANSISDPVPYTVVRILSGVSPIDGRNQAGESVRIVVVIGVRNSSRDNIAHKDLLGVMQRIKHRLLSKSCVKNFALAGNVEWAIDDESPWPYSFGGMDMTWKAIAIKREDELT